MASKINDQVARLGKENRKLHREIQERDTQIYLLTRRNQALMQSLRAATDPASPSLNSQPRSLVSKKTTHPQPLLHKKHLLEEWREESVPPHQLPWVPKTEEPQISSLPPHFSITYGYDSRFIDPDDLLLLCNRDPFLVLSARRL